MKNILFLTLATAISISNAFAQFDGTFESGNSISINGWSVANDYINAWYVGAPGANSGTNGAFVSNDYGYSNNYSGQTAQYSHLYTKIDFPAGKTDIELSFNWKCKGQTTWSGLKIFLVPLSYNIQAGVQIGNFSSNPYGIIGPGADWTGIYAEQITWQTETITLSDTLAGTSKYLVFSWENNNNYYPNLPPISLDNVVLSIKFPPLQLQTAVVGDSIELSISNYIGTNQWQESTDSVNWVDIPGFTHNTEQFIVTASPTNKKFYRAKITDSNCLPQTPVYSRAIRYIIKNAYSDLQIGDFYKGGAIFNTDGNGNGLVAPIKNQNNGVIWGYNGISVTNAWDHWNGINNTNLILNKYTVRPIAASVCYDLEQEGFDDWYLPAHDQLLLLYDQRSIVGGFDDNQYYWSSTEMSYSAVYTQQGESYGNSKENLFNTRCIRGFSSSQKTIYSHVDAPFQYNTIEIASQPQPQTICKGYDVSFSVSASGSSPYSYQWYKDGNSINDANNSSYTISNAQPSDDGFYYCETSNLCRTLQSNSVELKVIQLTSTLNNDTSICRGVNKQLSLLCNSNHTSESGSYNYAWSPSLGLSATNIANPIANPVTTTTYTVLTTDQIGCTSTDTIAITVGIPYEDENICLVTVDEATGKNKITWNKTENVGTDMFLIYKETGANSYSNVGYTNYNQSGEFVDIFSQPQSYANRYKLVCLDTCGNESQLSYSHKTINLTLSATGSTMGLQWNDYVEESGTYIPTWYYIYRGTTPQNMFVIDSVSGGSGSYNDLNVFDLYYYKIGVKRDDGCNSTKAAQWAFSNPKENSSLLNNILNNYSLVGSLLLYPNPMNLTTTITIPNAKIENCELKIIDITGKIVRSISKNEIPQLPNFSLSPFTFTLNRENLKAGLYFVEIKGDRIYRGKLVVE